MIVFLLLLLVLVGGFIYFYVKNKGVGVDRPISEGFEISNADVGKSIFYYGLYRKQWNTADTSAWQQWENITVGGDWTSVPPNARLATSGESNYYRRNGGITINRDAGPRFGQDLSTHCVLLVGNPWEKHSFGNEKTKNAYFGGQQPYVNFDNWYDMAIIESNDGNRAFGYLQYLYMSFKGVQIIQNTLCKEVGDYISKRSRKNITITDGPTANFAVTPQTEVLINENYPNLQYKNKDVLNNNCSNAIINGTHEFNRQCDRLCNETYVNTFLRFGVAFNAKNLSVCDGCNLEQDLLGDPGASPPIPPLGSLDSTIPQPNSADLIVTRSLTDLGSKYMLRLPQNARYRLGGQFADPRLTKLKYRVEVSVLNGTQQVFTGFIDNVQFSTNQQVIEVVFVDGTGFQITTGTAPNTQTYTATTTTYHETAGDVASFTINAYADASFDGRYDYYNNQGTSTASAPANATTANRTGFVLSTQSFFPLYRGSVTGSLGDMSGNILTLTYDQTAKTAINATFSIISQGSQPQSRILGTGTYSIYASNETTDFFAGKSRTLQITSQANRLLIDKDGYIQAFALNGTQASARILSDLSEKAEPQEFNMQIRDASGRFIYYSTPQPFTIIGNRYPPTTAPAATALQECFLIQETDRNGNVLANAKIPESDVADLCANFDGRIATIADLQADLAAGADWCADGWVQITPTLKRAAHPVTTSSGNKDCLPQSTRAISSNGTIVVTDKTDVSGVICYGTKPPNDSIFELNIRAATSTTTATSGRFFKVTYFNAFKKQWARTSKGDKMEVFTVKRATTLKQNQDICYTLGFVRATKAQLDALAEEKTNTTDMTEPAFVADDRVRSFVVVNESAGDSRLSTSGQSGVNESATPSVFANYCYGTKPTERTLKDASNNTYTILDYNARRRVWSQYSLQPYKTYNLTNKKVIDAEKDAYRKAALIVNDIQSSGVATVKKPDNRNPYIGCDTAAYGCKPTAAAERDTAPAQLVSRTKKFKELNETTPVNANDITPAGIQRAINFVLACQRAGGAVPTADGEYPGCEGPCCVPEESEGRLDASMFEEACDAPKASASVEECDADADVAELNMVNFEPYKLTRVVKTPTNGAKPRKCTSAKLDPALKKQVSQSLFKDVLSSLKNEKLFSLRMPATQ